MGLIDGNDCTLQDGIYIAPDAILSTEVSIYKIKVSGETFTARSHEGYLPIIDFKEASKNFKRLSVPSTNARFLESLIE